MRGFHYQVRPYEESKTISCLQGSLYDIVVDIRPNSKTFLKWRAFELDAQNRTSLHVPAGCANAYLTMSDNTLVHYYMSECYAPESYRGFRYNDPLFRCMWPREPMVISEKDAAFPDFNPEDIAEKV
jgi:dTDP-4-dehydrorhamnose 3,5-epimerase